MDAGEDEFVTRPTDVTKAEFVRMLEDMPEDKEMSWIVTEARAFDWVDLNGRKKECIDELRGLDFATACMSVAPAAGGAGPEYSSFRIVP